MKVKSSRFKGTRVRTGKSMKLRRGIGKAVRVGNVVGGRNKLRLEARGVEVVQKTNGKMVAAAMRRMRDICQKATKDNHKSEAEIMKELGVKRYEK